MNIIYNKYDISILKYINTFEKLSTFEKLNTYIIRIK